MNTRVLDHNNNIKFTRANFSEEGLDIQDITTKRCLDEKHILCSIKKIFFSFDGSESIFNKIKLDIKYFLKWDLHVEKMIILNESFEINDFNVENNKLFFIKARKISNIGKVSALDLEFGYNEPMGWKMSSKMMTYKDGEIYFLGNKVGFGKAKINFFDLNFNMKSTSGLILNSCFNRDFNDYMYLSFGYYFLPKDETFDFTISPMIYVKDLGLSCELRDLVYNIEVSVQAERVASYLVNKMRSKKEKRNERNIIIGVKSNNKILDADFSIFNKSFYNQDIWQSINYQNFLLLDKDYWGSLYFNLDLIKVTCLQRNHENVLRFTVEPTNFFKIKAEKSFKGEQTVDLGLFKRYFIDLDLFLIDWKGELTYTVFRENEFLSLDFKNLVVKSGIKIDLPMMFLEKNLFRFSVELDVDGEFLDFFKSMLKKINFNGKKYKLSSVMQSKINVECAIDTEQFDSKFFIKNPHNFGFELSNFEALLGFVDSIAIEKKDDKLFIGLTYLQSSKSFGFKLSSTQLLLEFLFTLQDFIKFKFLGSYNYQDMFFKKDNFKDKNTYINFVIEFMSQSWQLSFGFGIRNTKNNVLSHLYHFSIKPKVQLSFDEIEEIFKDLDLEKAKIFSLYDDFK